MTPEIKPKVLMIAYACNPEGSGEHWLGWGWAEQASNNFSVHLIAPPNARREIELHAPKFGIKPYFVSLPGWFRMLTGCFGRFGGWWRKLVWQRKVMRFAAELHRRESFDLLHQTTFHTFRVPFLTTRLGIPSVWGPIAGGESIPINFYGFIGPLMLPEAIRRLFNRLWLHLPSVQESLRRANVLLVSNHTTMNFLPEFCRTKAIIVPPNAVRPEDEFKSGPIPVKTNKIYRLLYVGNCLATRAMPLAFFALALSRIRDVEFHIVGTGAGLSLWKRKAAEAGILDCVKFVGQVPRSELASYYENADVLVFPALRDSGGSALLEAMSKGLPVVCLDWGGPAEIVTPETGILVSVTSPMRTIQAFAAALLQLQRYPELRARLGRRGRDRAQSLFTWNAKRELLEKTYRRLLAKTI